MKYDVVGKTIGRLRADMESGATTSKEITEAYLDRIEFYDKGQFGFNAYEIVAADAMRQARAADRARRMGATGPLLGIPIAVKNLYEDVNEEAAMAICYGSRDRAPAPFLPGFGSEPTQAGWRFGARGCRRRCSSGS